MPNDIIIDLQNISKSFPGAKVLHDVSFHIKRSEILGVVGGNGAGKSTLMKIITGVHSKDPGGKITIDGQEVNFRNYDEAKRAGIVMLFQEIGLIQTMTVAENMFFDRYDAFKNKFGLINYKKLKEESKEVLGMLNIDIDPNARVSELDVVQQKMCEICTVLSKKAKVLVLDEPTAPLSLPEIKTLFKLLRRIKNDSDLTIIYISHIFEEILDLCNRVLVIRDGKLVKISSTQAMNKDHLVESMLGKQLNKNHHDRIGSTQSADRKSTCQISLEDLSKERKYSKINLKAYKGEILGLAGVMGSGTSALGRTIFGLEKPEQGRIVLNGCEKRIRNPIEAVKEGIAYLPPDRKNEGLILNFPLKPNVALAYLGKLMRFGRFSIKKEKEIVQTYINNLAIKVPSIQTSVDKLSGGNQQKVMFAKWLATNAELIVLDRPTVGIDIKTKEEIYRIIFQLAERGCAIIIISQEIDELLKTCDRIIAISKGKIANEFIMNERLQEADIVKCL